MKKEMATPIESSHKKTRSNLKPKPSGKLESMLYRFACGKKFHRFSAERVMDHCLPSTISSLQQAHGIWFARKWISVPNRLGTETRVMSYWLEGKDLEKARKIAGLQEAA